MNRSSQSAAAVVITPVPAAHVRVVLDAIVRAHRPLLVRTAAEHLGTQRQHAEDIVQDVCLAVLEGQVELSPDPRAALLDVLKAVAGAAREEVIRASRRRKRA
jgi:DNA-directed RNA polymerase specialized sigma24 family protein